jgi:hypothetical protein
MKIAILFSGGLKSVYALHRLQKTNHEVVCLHLRGPFTKPIETQAVRKFSEFATIREIEIDDYREDDRSCEASSFLFPFAANFAIVNPVYSHIFYCRSADVPFDMHEYNGKKIYYDCRAYRSELTKLITPTFDKTRWEMRDELLAEKPEYMDLVHIDMEVHELPKVIVEAYNIFDGTAIIGFLSNNGIYRVEEYSPTMKFGGIYENHVVFETKDEDEFYHFWREMDGRFEIETEVHATSENRKQELGEFTEIFYGYNDNTELPEGVERARTFT